MFNCPVMWIKSRDSEDANGLMVEEDSQEGQFRLSLKISISWGTGRRTVSIVNFKSLAIGRLCKDYGDQWTYLILIFRYVQVKIWTSSPYMEQGGIWCGLIEIWHLKAFSISAIGEFAKNSEFPAFLKRNLPSVYITLWCQAIWAKAVSFIIWPGVLGSICCTFCSLIHPEVETIVKLTFCGFLIL